MECQHRVLYPITSRPINLVLEQMQMLGKNESPIETILERGYRVLETARFDTIAEVEIVAVSTLMAGEITVVFGGQSPRGSEL